VIGRMLIAFACAALCHAEVIYKISVPGSVPGKDERRVVDVPAEKYVAAVLAGESSVFSSDEALKAMAVAARTYAARLRGRHAAERFDFCTTTHCQRADLASVTTRTTKAALETAGELLWFEGKPAYAVYSRSCGGITEDARVIWSDMESPSPYLIAHADPYCNRGGAADWNWSVAPRELQDALRQATLHVPPDLLSVTVLKQTASGRASTLGLTGAAQTIPIAASSLRFAVGRTLGWNTLRSERYRVTSARGRIWFSGSGEGHGAGLCQRGADEMGKEGFTYREILRFYYPGAAVARTAAGFAWQHLGGDGITILTTRPDRDRRVLLLAERCRRAVLARFPQTGSRTWEIRVYPDLDAFRNATGEPGWVAARSEGATIEMQPADVLEHCGVLEATLHHEMLHLVVESEAANGLPMWFREGLVECLAKPASRHANTGLREDRDIEQRADRRRAGQAYAAAEARVATLIERHGEPIVFGWLKRGLPADVKNSSASSADTKSK
jgi:stage II sporulation protein D